MKMPLSKKSNVYKTSHTVGFDGDENYDHLALMSTCVDSTGNDTRGGKLWHCSTERSSVQTKLFFFKLVLCFATNLYFPFACF